MKRILLVNDLFMGWIAVLKDFGFSQFGGVQAYVSDV